LEIGRELAEYSSTEVNHGRLYPNLNDLIGEGLLSKDQKDGRTNLYRLTPLARELIAERRQWEAEKLQEAEINFD
jgi:DNA-binding PadR family transcriptional regulator